MKINLVPDITNPSPDYYCTWQTQLYYTNDGGPLKQRENITENNIFGTNPGQGWINFHAKAKSDLFFVMDDSWDVPLNGDGEYYGCLVLNSEKFESCCKGRDNKDALKTLSDRVKAAGWKGVGGWVCAQESKHYKDGLTIEQYWKQRLLEADYADFKYWKVDWGGKGKDAEFRKMLTELAREYAPNLIVENAMVNAVIEISDVFRSYDVPAVMSIPMTMEKLAQLLMHTAKPGSKGIINCEDEAYIGAALGCSIGIMRHNLAGNFLNGKPDMSFSECHRNIKTKLDEVIRAVRWHRIAPAFGVCEKDTFVSDIILEDDFEVIDQPSEIEAWWGYKNGDIIKKSAPSLITRGINPQKVTMRGDVLPYVVASKNPNGAVSIATLGRTVARRFYTPLCDITLDIKNADTVGVFGYYESLTLKTSHNTDTLKILIQDLADDSAHDITDSVICENGNITIDGKIITDICTKNQSKNDTSEPGVVIALKHE